MIERLIRAAFAKPAGRRAPWPWRGPASASSALRDLPRDVFPDLSAPVFNVIVQNPAMGAEELETGIAVPMEVALAGLPAGAARAVQLAARRVPGDGRVRAGRRLLPLAPARGRARRRRWRRSFPPGTDAPLLSSLTGRLNEIFEFTLEAEPGTVDLMTLRDLAEFEVRNRLLAVPGVAAVETLGGHLRQFQVQLDPDRMSARGVTLDEVMHALEGANENAAGGFVVQGSSEWTVRAVGPGRAEPRTCAARSSRCAGATPVLLGDVADVREDAAVRRGIAHRLRGRGRELPGHQAVRRRHREGGRAACARRIAGHPAERFRRA